MKLLHTADWHIGKLVHGIHMTEDQRYILDALVQLVKDEGIDVLIIAGDVYDRSVPPIEAVALMDETMTKLIVDLGVKVIMIPGNHDSADRLAFGNKILKDKGLYICSDIQTEDIKPIVINDRYGPVNFYPIPFAEPAVVRGITGDETIKTHDEALGKIIEKIKLTINPGERNICISHAFVIGEAVPESSDSERMLSLGGAAYVRAEHFLTFDYTALGHIHRPQRIGADHIRYAGSLLKYSFSEVTQKKSVTCINLGEKNTLEISQKSLKPKRDMRRIRGPLDKLLMPDLVERMGSDDYIAVELTDSGALFEPMKKLRAIYPNILELTRQKNIINASNDKLSLNDLKEVNDDALFEMFFAEVTGNTIDEATIEAFRTHYNQLKAAKGDDI